MLDLAQACEVHDPPAVCPDPCLLGRNAFVIPASRMVLFQDDQIESGFRVREPAVALPHYLLLRRRRASFLLQIVLSAIDPRLRVGMGAGEGMKRHRHVEELVELQEFDQPVRRVCLRSFERVSFSPSTSSRTLKK